MLIAAYNMYRFVAMVNEFLRKEFGNRIKELRTKSSLSQEKLSFITGFHRTYIGMIERGERNISLTNIAVFAKAFEMDLSEILNFKNSDTCNNFHLYQTKSEK